MLFDDCKECQQETKAHDHVGLFFCDLHRPDAIAIAWEEEDGSYCSFECSCPDHYDCACGKCECNFGIWEAGRNLAIGVINAEEN